MKRWEYTKKPATSDTAVLKNADPVEYRIATGIEALFGELYLEGKIERINELFSILAGSADDI